MPRGGAGGAERRVCRRWRKRPTARTERAGVPAQRSPPGAVLIARGAASPTSSVRSTTPRTRPRPRGPSPRDRWGCEVADPGLRRRGRRVKRGSAGSDRGLGRRAHSRVRRPAQRRRDRLAASRRAGSDRAAARGESAPRATVSRERGELAFAGSSATFAVGAVVVGAVNLVEPFERGWCFSLPTCLSSAVSCNGAWSRRPGWITLRRRGAASGAPQDAVGAPGPPGQRSWPRPTWPRSCQAFTSAARSPDSREERSRGGVLWKRKCRLDPVVALPGRCHAAFSGHTRPIRVPIDAARIVRAGCPNGSKQAS